ncbi:MAG: hypothetical protein LUC43_05760, partial [Burkholderiales bacterium]|nr:hypothetical protein [Burkholderiales bacterium]
NYQWQDRWFVNVPISPSTRISGKSLTVELIVLTSSVTVKGFCSAEKKSIFHPKCRGQVYLLCALEISHRKGS